MTQSDPIQQRFGKSVILLLAVGISIVFLLMVRGFLVAILLAGIFSAMAYPLYRRALKLLKGRRTLSSLATITIVLLLIVMPVMGFLTVVVSQAVQVSQSVGPWVERQVSQPDELDRLLSRVPYVERLQPYQDQIVTKIGELASSTGRFLVSKAAAATRGTVAFLLNLFVMLYAMFFFLADGRAILNRILYYLPLTSDDENRMVEKFVSVTRATLKGTLVIGMVQGSLAGIAFWIAGINGPAFWGTVMAVLSIIPGIGAALVWIPAVVYLLAVGKLATAVALAAWCAVVVGTVDNVLRPRLVGRDVKMSDLLILVSTLGGILLFGLILVSTLGGILLFGAVGFILGPIVAALFVTIWDIYGAAFKDLLPEVTGPAAG
jgi:predicted PurR-regulated permease PerM